MSELKAVVKEKRKVSKSGRENIDTINDIETLNLTSNVASKALTLSDLVDTWEPKLKHKEQIKAEKTDSAGPMRNIFKLILEGKMTYDESAFEFEIEQPPQVELDSQIALMNLRVTTDLPKGSEYDEP